MTDASASPHLDGAQSAPPLPRGRRRLSVVAQAHAPASGVTTLGAPSGADPDLEEHPTGHAPAEVSDAAQPTHRRRSRWFELNPGCFGRAALVAVGGAVLGAAGILAVWRMRRLFLKVAAARLMWKRARRAWGRGRRAWALAQRVRGRVGGARAA